MTTLQTAHLTLRPITAADLTDERIIGWHTDAEGYELMAESAKSRDEAIESLQLWHEGWDTDGLSYWIAEHAGQPVGIGGVRAMNYQNHPHLNLYYRLDPGCRGRSFGTEIACAATAYAAEHYAAGPVVTRISPINAPSLRTAERCGMTDLGPFRMPQDPPDSPDNLLFESPRALEGVGDAYDELLDLWCRVNEAGGSVGFEGAAPQREVAAVLDGHLAATNCTLVRLHAPTVDTWQDPESVGDLLGFGFIQRATWFSVQHRATLLRVMTDPDLRGRNYGRILIGALHAAARRDGVEICEISYRGGTGLEHFYDQFGYVETGRVPGGLRFSWGEVDDVSMARRL